MLHAKQSSPLVSAGQSHLGCLAAALCQQVDENPLILLALNIWWYRVAAALHVAASRVQEQHCYTV